MPVNNHEILIDHLDKTIQGESLPEAEALLANDNEAREDFQYLQTAVEAVKHTALHARVAAVRAEMQPAAVVPIRKTEAHTITRNILRVAAVLFLLLGSVTVYKLVTVSSGDLFQKHYTSYTLNTARGEEATSPLEQAYRNNSWSEVSTQYEATVSKTSKDHFLAAMASMELEQYPQAIERLNAVLNNNVRTGDNYFQDEAEYYLALAYVADDKAEEAAPLLKRISAEDGHLYQQKAKDIIGIDLKILELK
jgi:tetratricopeptide (TPR) repeat protein